MSEIADRYRRLSSAFAEKIANVGEGQWSAPTPCPDWEVKDLVSHVIGTQGMFLGFIGQEMGDIPDAEADPAGAWDAARARIQAGLDDPATAKTEFEGAMGRSTFEDAVNRFLCFDLVVHGWDLARATGQDEKIDPDDVVRVRTLADGMGPAMRGPGAFGPEREAPPDADDQQRLIAFLGREP